MDLKSWRFYDWSLEREKKSVRSSEVRQKFLIFPEFRILNVEIRQFLKQIEASFFLLIILQIALNIKENYF